MSGALVVPAANLPVAPSLRGKVAFGMAVTVFGFFGIVAWFGLANLSGAVVAPGAVVVESDVKKVQHQTGGIVGAIMAANGQRVRAGETLIRLDETIPRTNLGQIVAQLTQLVGRRARLEAERDGHERLRLPENFAAFGPGAPLVAAGEQRLLDEDRATRAQQTGQLRERIGQFEREIEGLVAQRAANGRQAELIRDELRGVQDLYNKNLAPITRLASLQREAARLDGENGQLAASVAKTRGQISEIKLQLLAIPQKARADAVKELREVESNIAQLIERRIAAEDILARIDIRAPQSGFVHEMTVHTVGGVIAPGETLMQIVPDNDRLAIEIRVSPADIDQLQMGQKAVLRLSAFNQRTTPELTGTLARIAADATREPQTGAMYYIARVTIDDTELRKLQGLTLQPGMPAEVFVETGERAAWSYFAKPLIDAFHRAFREE